VADGDEPKKPLPIADMQGLSGRELAQRRAQREAAREGMLRAQKLAHIDNKPPAVAGSKPTSLEDARDLNARALGEVLLKPKSIRRFERLLWSKEDRTAKEMFALAFNHILSTAKGPGGEQKPTQVIVNNLVARPEKKDETTVEVR